MRKREDVNEELARKRRKRLRHGVAAAVLAAAACLTALLLFLGSLGRTATEAPAIQPTESLSETQPTQTVPPTEPVADTAPETTQPPTDPQPPETVSAQERAGSLLASMSRTEKIYQLFIVRPETLTEDKTQAVEGLSDILDAQSVGGIVLFSGNVENPEQCTALIASFQSASPLPLFVAVDEEGGSVSRLASNPAMGMTRFPSMGEVGQSRSREDAYQVGLTIGGEIRALGFNLDFAPVADVNSNPDNPVIGSRAFSDDPEVAADLVSGCVWGFYDAQVISCLKHFPGHGDTAADTHLGYAETGKTLGELEETELLPFRAGLQAGCPMVMVGHIACPKVTGDTAPASLSPRLVQGLLREELGFQGVVVTDAMEMGAITEAYPAGEAAVLALEAGCDLILLPENLPEAAGALEEALDSGRLTEARLDESVRRILELKLQYGIIP